MLNTHRHYTTRRLYYRVNIYRYYSDRCRIHLDNYIYHQYDFPCILSIVNLYRIFNNDPCIFGTWFLYYHRNTPYHKHNSSLEFYLLDKLSSYFLIMRRFHINSHNLYRYMYLFLHRFHLGRCINIPSESLPSISHIGLSFLYKSYIYLYYIRSIFSWYHLRSIQPNYYIQFALNSRRVFINNCR